MTNRKNYNSILFLTVYLGLVLVGGHSHVFAHAATNSLFDLRSEIEFKEDLDNKPDEEKADTINTSNALEVYFGEIEKFIEDLKKLQKIEKFDLDYDTFEVSELGFVPCNVDGDPVRRAERLAKIQNPNLDPIIEQASYSFAVLNFLSDCLKDDKFESGLSTNSRYGVSYDKSNLNVEITSFKNSPTRAIDLTTKLNDFLKKYQVREDERIIKVIYENTKVSSSNNQVFIVTRLPRGSIDSLLK